MEFHVSQENPIRAQELQDGDEVMVMLITGSLNVRMEHSHKAVPGGSVSVRLLRPDGKCDRKRARLFFDKRGFLHRVRY
ncbi:MAG: hypothetical protein ABH846_00765 [Patescibacteria group bacterium]